MKNKRLLEELDLIFLCLKDTEYNWIDVKKILIRSLPPKLREGFSRRDRITKVPKINQYEMSIIKTWKDRYGESLPLRGDEIHEQS